MSLEFLKVETSQGNYPDYAIANAPNCTTCYVISRCCTCNSVF